MRGLYEQVSMIHCKVKQIGKLQNSMCYETPFKNTYVNPYDMHLKYTHT